jgi:hypothetical protein
VIEDISYQLEVELERMLVVEMWGKGFVLRVRLRGAECVPSVEPLWADIQSRDFD